MDAIARVVRADRGDAKQQTWADAAGISRTKLSMIENATRGYQSDVLLKALGVKADPVAKLLSIREEVDRLTSSEIRACWTLIAALRSGEDHTREFALNVIQALDEINSTDSKVVDLREQYRRLEREKPRDSRGA